MPPDSTITTFLPRASIWPASKRGKTDHSARLNHELEFAEGKRDGLAHFRFGCGNALRKQLAVDGKSDLAGDRRHQRVADGAALGMVGLAPAGA